MKPSFPHERLDAWHVARLARKVARQFTATLPPGYGTEARQLTDAAASVVRNIGEGANRWRPAEKVHKPSAGPDSKSLLARPVKPTVPSWPSATMV
jgi:hypothetical protein